MNFVPVGVLFITVCGLLVQVGRLMERQKVHGETLKEHRTELDELGRGHIEVVELRGEMRGIRDAITGLRADLTRILEKM